MKEFTLVSGTKIPALGFGPDEYGYTPHPRKVHQDLFHRAFRKLKRITIGYPRYIDSVASAFQTGYRLFDFSAAYGDGSLITKAIKKSGIPREKIMITTRVSNRAQYNGKIEEELQRQLKGFQTDYVDVLMFHWPVTDHYEDTWLKMLELKEKGYCKILGVANCHQHHLERLKEISGVYPEINQIEMHPLFTQESLRKFCQENYIQVEAYSPTARQDDRLVNPPRLKRLAKKYNKSITQVILRWHIQHGVIPVIRSLTPLHQKEDFNIFDFEITAEDMQSIDDMNINARIRYDPDNCDFTAL